MVTNRSVSGRVVKVSGRLFHVKTDDGLVICSVRQTVKDTAEHELSPVVVGDIVNVTVDEVAPSEGEQRHGVIESVIPRKTRFIKRKSGLRKEKTQVVVSNIDQMIIVASVRNPAFKMRLIDRFIIAAYQGEMKPVLIVNKTDLNHTLDLDRIKSIYRTVNVTVLEVSAVSGNGVSDLRDILKGNESVFVGQSGVGKSSLLNAIQPGLSLKIGVVSGKTGKGKHTTTVVELFPLDIGGFIVDTPGLRALGLTKLDRNHVDMFYDEIQEASTRCRFSDCSHVEEPGCAVKEAVDRGEIFRERYESYIRILEDL